MKKLVYIISFITLASCASDSFDVDVERTVSLDPVSGQSEVFTNYMGAPIHFEEEKQGNKSFIVQEIQQQRQDVIFRMKKIPSALYVKKENPGMSDLELEDALSDLKSEQIFYFEIEEEMKQDLLKKYFESDYEEGVSYLAFGIQNDLKLYTESGDTLTPSFTLLERNFHLAPFERIIIDFNGVKEGQSFDLVYSDKLFGKGEIVFSFPNDNFVENNVKEIL